MIDIQKLYIFDVCNWMSLEMSIYTCEPITTVYAKTKPSSPKVSSCTLIYYNFFCVCDKNT